MIVIIAKFYPNSCTIATLLLLYASAVKEALTVATLSDYADIVAARLYSVDTFTRDFAKLSFKKLNVINLSNSLLIRCNVLILL